MASSDEEGEIMLDCITGYQFFGCNNGPVSFSSLPVHWCGSETPDGLPLQIFLKGTVDSGLRKIYKQVVAWKFELAFVKPEISVLTRDKIWIKLQKPLRSFQCVVRTILITVHWLHFVKRNPQASGTSIWTTFLKVFGSYDVEPSENDLLDHKALIVEAAKRDRDLANSMYLQTFLLKIPSGKKVFDEDLKIINKPEFIVDNDIFDGEDDIDEAEADDLFDTVCSFCDNGGEVLCCEGVCIRSFHATIEASGAESFCQSLGFSDAQVKAIQNFRCDNCRYKQHQCFACGKLGSSDKSFKMEVFPCVSATCGHFYHPKCVAKLLHRRNEIKAAELEENISAGKSFACPLHKCFVCRENENKNIYDLQFAICRRCPKAYHRKCLPRIINEDAVQRAWENLLPKRILIYCMDHVMDREFGTPPRGHIRFPVFKEKKNKHVIRLAPSKDITIGRNRIIVPESTNKRCSKEVTPAKKRNIDDVKRESVKANINSLKVTLCKVSLAGKNNLRSRCNDLKPMVASGSLPDNMKQQSRTSSWFEIVRFAEEPSEPTADSDMEKRLLALMKNSVSTFNEEEFIKKQKVTSTYASSSKHALSRLTQGKVDHFVKAVRTALQRLDEGCSIEDAKAVCEQDILFQLVTWKNKLDIYLAPFLHGPRYTSFGRHFTNVDKLMKIVNRLHWYVQNGDMLVDFCCGSNDFSCLMKEKLKDAGKKCFFKNYDLHPAKRDFNFELRDWMSVGLEELPTGSNLIMGLNPPFGFKATLANKFINKALEFKPKLLILIVPSETRRLDEKENPYDLIWEDGVLLSGKSFYLPGSVDVHEKRLEQWNLKTPPLYLWSRPDFTAMHREIAQNHGHIISEQSDEHAANTSTETAVSNYLMEEKHDCFGDFSNIINAHGDISCILDDIPEDDDEAEPEKTGGPVPNQQVDMFGAKRSLKNNGIGKKLNLENLYKGEHGFGQSRASLTGNQDHGTQLENDGMEMDMEFSNPVNSPSDRLLFK